MEEENELPGYNDQFDILDEALKLKNGDGSLYKRTNTGNTEVGRNTSFGDSKYDKNFFPNISVNWDDSGMNLEEQISENRAQNQPWIDKAGAGLGRVGAKVVAEVLKMPGVVGGVIAGGVGQAVDGFTGKDNTDFMQTAFNNGWIKAINEGNEHVNKEFLPVYVKKAVEEGNLWDNVTAIDFWATEGADGLGYIISMLAPGAAINKLGLGSKLFKAGAAAARGTKFSRMIKSVDNALGKMSGAGSILPTTPKSADLWGATIANTLFEAGAEAQGAMDGYEKGLRAKLEKGEINEYQFESMMQKASQIGRDVFLFNTAVLVGPNAIMSKMIWGGKTNKAVGIKLEAGAKLATEVPTLGQKVGKVTGDVALAAGREGFFEEGLQTTGEGYISDSYKNNTNYSLGGLATAYMDMLQTTEGQKAILLGAVFGGGMQGYFGAKHRGQDQKKTQELVDLGNKSIEDMYSVLNEDIYLRNEDGSVKVDEEGKPVYDEYSLIEKMQGAEKLEGISAYYDWAVENGDTEGINKVKEVVTTNLAMPFIVNENLGLEVLRQHLNASKDLAKIADREGQTAEEYVAEIMDKAKVLEKAHETFNDFAPSVIAVEDERAKPEDFTKFYNKLNTAYIISKSREFHLDKRLKSANSKLNELLKEKGVSQDESADYYGTPSKDIRIDKVQSEIASATKELAEVKQDIEKLWSKGEAQTRFKSIIDEKVQLEKDLETESVKAEKALSDIKKAGSIEEVDAILNSEKALKNQEEEKKRVEEEAVIKEVEDSVNTDSSLDNLKHNVTKLKSFGDNASPMMNKALKAIENRIGAMLNSQKQLGEYLEKVFDELILSVDKSKASIKELDAKIKENKAKKYRIIRSIKDSDRNPKGRNAKLIKELVAETEREVRLIEQTIAILEKEKQKLEEEVIKLEEGIDYISQRHPQIAKSEFTNIEDIIKYLEENSKRFEEHRFDIERLLIHKHYTEQNIQGLEEAIQYLETYKYDVLDALEDYTELKGVGHTDTKILRDKALAVTKELFEKRQELDKAKDKLESVNKALIDKQAIKAVTKELEFWNNVQKGRKAFRRPRSLNNPVVYKASEEKKKQIKKEKEEAKKKQIARVELSKEAAEALEEAKDQGKLTAKNFYDWVQDNIEEGMEIPTPPPSVVLPKSMREMPEDDAYFIKKKEDDAITVGRGTHKQYKITGARLGVKKAPKKAPKETPQSEDVINDPLYNTEGGLTDKVLEPGDALPVDENGEVITENLAQVNNDARVITGTDGGAKLPFINQGMIDYERAPVNKKTREVTFEVNRSYTGAKHKKALEYLDAKDASKLDFIIEHLAINTIFNKDSGAIASLETFNENPNLKPEEREEYNKVFNKSSKQLRAAIIKEIVLNKTDIKDISTTIAGQKPGDIQVAPKVDGRVVENSVLELREFEGDIKKVRTEDIYVVNDQNVLENVNGIKYPIRRDLSPGEIYIMIKTANGTRFPLKLNVKKITEQEADLLYDIYLYRLENDYAKVTKATPIQDTSADIVKKVETLFAEELGERGLFTKNKKALKDLTIGDVVNFLIWDGTNSVKSQVRFFKGQLKVLGDTYTLDELKNGKASFIANLTEYKNGGKRRNISFKRKKNEGANSLNFNNRSYVEYVLQKGILNTNAVTGKDENGLYKPTFQGDTTLYLSTNTVRVNKGLSQYNEAKILTFRDKLRGTLKGLKQDLGKLFEKTLSLAGESHYVADDPKDTLKYQRISYVTSPKEEKEDMNTPMFYNAAKRGDVVDALFRDYFSVGFASEEVFVSKAKEVLKKVNENKSRYGDIYMSENLFKELYNIAREYEIEFNKRGYTIYSTTNPLWGWLRKGGKNMPTAGSMDLLAKDSNGRYVIIDIKSSTMDRYENYEREDSFYKDKDLRQQNGYRELFYQRTKIKIDDILILPLTFEAEKQTGKKVNSTYTNVTRTKSPTMFIEVDTSRDIYEIMGEERYKKSDTSDPNKKTTKGYKPSPNRPVTGRDAWGDLASSKGAPIFEGYEDPDVMSGPVETDEWGPADDFMQGAEEAFEGLDIADIMLKAGITPSDKVIAESKQKKVTKSKPKSVISTPKAPSKSGIGVKFELEGKKYDLIYWSDGTVTDKDNKRIVDASVIEAAKKTTGKTDTEIRKTEKKDVSLQETEKFMSGVDVSKLSDAEVKNGMNAFARARTLSPTIKKDLRSILIKKGLSPQEQLQEMVDIVMDKAAANSEVKQICSNLTK